MSFWREINAADPVDTRSAYDKLNDEKGELQAKYEAVVAELEAAQGEIDRIGLECNKLKNSYHGQLLNELKAETIRKAAMSICSDNYGDVCYPAEYDDLNEYANKLERGEL